LPKPIHASLALEIAWSVIPFGLTMIMFAWAPTYSSRKAAAQRRHADLCGRQAMDVEAAAHGGQREINELHIPVGRPVSSP